MSLVYLETSFVSTCVTDRSDIASRYRKQVSLATIHRCDYVLTWNVRHLANVNKVRHLQIICLRVGYVAPNIVTPDIFGEEAR